MFELDFFTTPLLPLFFPGLILFTPFVRARAVFRRQSVEVSRQSVEVSQVKSVVLFGHFFALVLILG